MPAKPVERCPGCSAHLSKKDRERVLCASCRAPLPKGACVLCGAADPQRNVYLREARSAASGGFTMHDHELEACDACAASAARDDRTAVLAKLLPGLGVLIAVPLVALHLLLGLEKPWIALPIAAILGGIVGGFVLAARLKKRFDQRLAQSAELRGIAREIREGAEKKPMLSIVGRAEVGQSST